MGDVMLDLFGNATIAPKPRPDAFTRALPQSRPAMPDKTNRAHAPHAMPRDREIEIRDNARLLCKAGRPDDKGVAYLEGSQIKRNGGAPAGSSSPGRNALLGWGDVAPVNGLLQMQIQTEGKRR